MRLIQSGEKEHTDLSHHCGRGKSDFLGCIGAVQI